MGWGQYALPAAALAATLILGSAPAHAETDFGVRYWYGFGNTSKNLYDFTGSTLLSRLTYSGLNTNSAELYGRIGEGGVFLRGFVGLGSSNAGNLQDEDFPPGVPGGSYSSTNSAQQGGKVSYATGDIGYYFRGGANTRLGAFAGYNYFRQNVNAYGCTQTASNPVICVPAIDSSVLGISQTNNWGSVRLGLTGDARVGHFQIGGDAAVLYSHLSGADTHWLRIGTDPGDFIGPIPEDGSGWGYQLEANVDYRVRTNLTIGVGARYWHMQTSGAAHFENDIVGGGGGPQKETWQTTMYGLTAHSALSF
jgi:hypothetical protein